MQLFDSKQQGLQDYKGVLLHQEPVVIQNLGEVRDNSAFEKKGHVAVIEGDHVEYELHEGMLDVPEGLQEVIIPGHKVEKEIPFGDLVVCFVFGIEVVLLEWGQRVILVAPANDLIVSLHALGCSGCYNNFVFIRSKSQRLILEKVLPNLTLMTLANMCC